MCNLDVKCLQESTLYYTHMHCLQSERDSALEYDPCIIEYKHWEVTDGQVVRAGV